MQLLNLPSAILKYKEENRKQLVFDVIRKKYVALTPEEWVRQNFVHYLMNNLGYPAGLIAVETVVKINSLNQRADVVVYNRKGKPVMIIECKAPKVKIDNRVFEQAARYNKELEVNYLLVTNGLKHYCALLNSKDKNYKMLKSIPEFNDIDKVISSQ